MTSDTKSHQNEKLYSDTAVTFHFHWIRLELGSMLELDFVWQYFIVTESLSMLLCLQLTSILFVEYGPMLC